MGVLALNRNISSFSADQAQTCEGDITENLDRFEKNAN